MISISWLRSTGSDARSSSVIITTWPSSPSNAFSMSSNGTTSPHFSQTRLYRIRPMSRPCTCRNRMSWSSVAL